MKMNGTFTLVGADKYKMDSGQSGGKLYIMSDIPSDDPNKCGREINSAKVDYDQFESMVRQHHNDFPNKFDCEFAIVAGAKKSSTMQIYSIKLSGRPATAK